MQKRSMTLSSLGVLAVAAALAGCDTQDDSQTVGQRVDQVLAQADQKAEQVRDRAAEGARDAREAMRQGGNDAREATAPAGNAIEDARITTEVNAAFAKDNALSALGIDVDTEGGKVLLKGDAPTAEAKDRATQLAQAVNGVTKVENQLTVQ